MKKQHKAMAVLLCLAACLGLLAGCSGSAEAAAPQSTAQDEAQSAEAPPQDENIKMGTVTSVEGSRVTLALGTPSGGPDGGGAPPDGESRPQAPSGSLPQGEPPQAPPDGGSRPEGQQPPQGGMQLQETGETLVLELEASVAITRMGGGDALAVTDIEVGDILRVEMQQDGQTPAGVEILSPGGGNPAAPESGVAYSQ